MSTAEAIQEFDEATKELGDKIVGLTLLEAKRLSDYLKEEHGIEPASGAAISGTIWCLCYGRYADLQLLISEHSIG